MFASQQKKGMVDKTLAREQELVGEISWCGSFDRSLPFKRKI